ncbi:MAG: hypothetical protein IIB44_06070 [Candidatus Marinimicrobia bacterium]|nr:hypothetical protein [Candidatus Neomarinimicrobiota bacterium]
MAHKYKRNRIWWISDGTGEDRKKLLTNSAIKTTMDYTHPNIEFTRNLIEKL